MALSSQELREYILKEFMGPEIVVVLNPLQEELDDNDMPEEPNSLNLNEIENLPQLENVLKCEYLNDDPLSRQFSLNRDYTKEYKLVLCLYNINTDLDTPFLQFLFEKKNSKFQFPIKDVNMWAIRELIESNKKIQPNNQDGDVSDDGNEDDENDIEFEFMNQCSQFYKEITGIGFDNSNKSFKGFTQNENNEIFIIFDLTNMNIENLQSSQQWAIIDEIIYKNRILTQPILESHVANFVQNPMLLFLKYDNGEPVDIPISGHLCKETENNESVDTEKSSYLNVYYEGSQNTISIVNKKIEHPIFSETFLFTEEPINYDNLDNIKRYAIFIKNSFYFLNKDMELKPMEDEIYRKFDCFSFYIKDKVYWSIENYDLFVEL
jgi:hypothetical protein